MVKVSAILLGAGQSKRMGANKLVLPWGKKTVFEQCLENLLHSRASEVIVVLSDRTKGFANRLKGARMKVVMNLNYREGMSTSIRRGIKSLDPAAEGILIALGDQPLLKASTINALIRAFSQRRGGIVVPVFRGRRGHPVLFDRRFEKDLGALREDVGGRSILQRYPEDVTEVRTRSEGVIKDIDTWKEYRQQLRMKS